MALPATASADSAVIVLGIRSIEGDDDVALGLSAAVRHEAASVPGWTISPNEISLAQMTLSFGCDEPDAACMAQIAENLEMDRIIYGTLRRTGAGNEYDYALTLYAFNAETGQIQDSLTDTIPRERRDIDDLRPRARRYVAQFGGQARYGTLRLEVNQPDATVRIDEQEPRTTDGSGVLLIEDLAEGQHQMQVDLEGFESYSSRFRIVPDEQTDVRANLIGETPTNLRWIPGVAVIAAGVVLAAIGVRSSNRNQTARDERTEVEGLGGTAPCYAQAIIDAIGPTGMGGQSGTVTAGAMGCPDRTFTTFQAMLLTTPQTDDVCESEATRDRFSGVDGICGDHKKHAVLQYVFYGLGIAAVTTGIILLIRSFEDPDDDDSSAVRLDVVPYATRGEGGLNATLTW